MKKVIILLVIVAVIVVAVAGVKNFLKPKTVSVNYSQKDYDGLTQKLGYTAKIVDIEGEIQPANSIANSGVKEVDSDITNVEATAAMNHWADSWKYAPLTNSSVKINSDDSFEYSGTFSVTRALGYASATGVPQSLVDTVSKYIKPFGGSFPVYLKGKVEILNNSVNADLSSVRVSFLSIPSDTINKYAGEVNNFVSERLSPDSKYKIEQFKIKEGKFILKGKLPEKIEYYK
ncbi:MAG: hypothetical protein UT34_C0001G0129 [candidate division WS6 bacterium GW2011_GWF2_39_15]|uniref:Uncharacterized protein n=1 Tax=candidate division WS6 bacterium GW2011_GWF2_39_15 TaxID=1619100 RepID=A0A0G0MPZ2_9BACT|nr:MAG: hypothetical protein UT34_C0001G0129 [candidate division WS6 bacterium GW2011_GWF2_39_15]